jgi:hypothetical protein
MLRLYLYYINPRVRITNSSLCVLAHKTRVSPKSLLLTSPLLAYHSTLTSVLNFHHKLRPEQPDENLPTVLFDPERFVEIALLAFIEEQDQVLHGVEHTYTLTDEQILEQIRKLTSHIDPLEWPSHYELNDDLVLMSRDMGRIWVPPNKQL